MKPDATIAELREELERLRALLREALEAHDDVVAPLVRNMDAETAAGYMNAPPWAGEARQALPQPPDFDRLDGDPEPDVIQREEGEPDEDV